MVMRRECHVCAPAGIIRPKAKGAVFCLMPFRIQAKAIGGLLKGRGPKQVVQPAVGNPNDMGFSAFYAAVLSHVSQLPHFTCTN